MIPPLPAELLSHILDLATSPSHAISAHCEDRLLLRQCCLVSKQLCAVAQPKLWLVLSSSKGDFIALSKYPQHARHVRALEYTTDSNTGPLSSITETLPNLMEARMRNGTLADAQLGSFSNLVHLTLFDVTIAASSAVAFPNLVSLSLVMVRMLLDNWATHFPATSFPSLRALNMMICLDSNDHRAFLEPVGLPPGQLDLHQVYMSDYSTIPPHLHERGALVALSFDIHNVGFMRLTSEVAGFKHLLLQSTNFELDETATDLSDLVSILISREQTLSLSLPGTLSLRSRLPATVSAARDRLLTLCSTRNIDIVWRPYSRTVEDDVGVSRDYWAYAKKFKSSLRWGREAVEGRKAVEGECRAQSNGEEPSVGR